MPEPCALCCFEVVGPSHTVLCGIFIDVGVVVVLINIMLRLSASCELSLYVNFEYLYSIILKIGNEMRYM